MKAEKARTSIPIGQKLDDRGNVWENPHSYDELPDEVKEFLVRKQKSKSRDERTALEILEGKHVLSLLLYLNTMSPVTKSDIYNDVARQNMAGKIEDLRKLGLVQVFFTGRTNANVVVITEKGRAVAELLSEILDIVEGRADP